MNFYQVNFTASYLFTGTVLGVLSVFIYSKNNRDPINLTFSIYSFSIAWWSLFSIFMINADTAETATFWDKICIMGVVFIPTTFLHFTFTFLKEIRKRKKFIRICYLISSIFFVLNFTPFFIKTTAPVYKLKYFTVPGPGYLVFLVYYSIAVIYGIFLLFKALKNSKGGLYRQQLSYLFWATLLGYSGGSLNYNLVLNFSPYSVVPWGNYLIGIYGLLIAYAIVKYRLMDIRLAITRVGIFVFVYTLVLGIPFGVGMKYLGRGWWLMPVSLMAVFATIGPFIYLYIQKKTEEALLKEQRQYQMTLQQASLGMGQIKELKRLLNLVVHIITRAVSVEHAEVYLLHEESKQYTLKASRGWRFKAEEQVSTLSFNSPLIRYLKKNRESVVCEEIEHYAQDNEIKRFKEVEGMIKRLKGALIVPSFMDQKLIAVLVLGNKKAGKLYTRDDLAVFTILANQAGLAIENAQFYERMKATHVQLVKAEKMATVGTMADGLSHQINNRLHAMGFIAGDALDTIRLKRGEKLTKKMKNFLDEIEHSFDRIEDNVKRGGEIVEGLLKYTRKGAEGFGAVGLNKLLDAALEMVQFKIKLSEMDFVRNFNDDIPNIHGNFTQLQEVFFNIIDNAYDAMMQRKNELKEPGYKARLEIRADQRSQKLEILINDNGVGVKKENLEKLFTPFFTTKLSSKKGTGLGLYVIRQIIEENHGGRVRFTSQYKKGSQTSILLPVAVGG